MKRVLIAQKLRWLNYPQEIAVTAGFVYYPCWDWPIVPVNFIAGLSGTT
jgi:hypothetical protein